MSYDKIDKDKEQKDKGGMRERDERVICRSGSRQQQSQITNKGQGRRRTRQELLPTTLLCDAPTEFYI